MGDTNSSYHFQLAEQWIRSGLIWGIFVLLSRFVQTDAGPAVTRLRRLQGVPRGVRARPRTPRGQAQLPAAALAAGVTAGPPAWLVLSAPAGGLHSWLRPEDLFSVSGVCETLIRSGLEIGENIQSHLPSWDDVRVKSTHNFATATNVLVCWSQCRALQVHGGLICGYLVHLGPERSVCALQTLARIVGTLDIFHSFREVQTFGKRTPPPPPPLPFSMTTSRQLTVLPQRVNSIDCSGRGNLGNSAICSLRANLIKYVDFAKCPDTSAIVGFGKLRDENGRGSLRHA